jgi:hypothetical protein
MSNVALRMLLWFLGQCIAQGSRWMPSVRSQITRSLTFELSAGEHVSRYWVFDAQLRRATTHSGRASTPDCAVHLRSSWQALRTLVSRLTVDKIIAGLHGGTVELHGSAFVLLWFYGLTRLFVTIGQPAGPRYEIPHSYLAHDDTACGTEKIVIEPAVRRLDPAWTAAWKARATLPNIRACTDEPMPEP